MCKSLNRCVGNHMTYANLHKSVHIVYSCIQGVDNHFCRLLVTANAFAAI